MLAHIENEDKEAHTTIIQISSKYSYVTSHVSVNVQVSTVKVRNYSRDVLPPVVVRELKPWVNTRSGSNIRSTFEPRHTAKMPDWRKQ